MPATLRHLGRHGADDFFTGELAARMARDLESNGAFVTADDLATYRVRNAETTWGTYRGLDVASSPAPHGGPTLVEILNILEGWDLRALGHNSPEYILRVALAMKSAFSDRHEYLGDPTFVDVPLTWLTSKESRRRMARAGSSAATRSPSTSIPCRPRRRPTCRSWTTTATPWRITHSLGGSSGVIGPGLGFMYNNSMVNYHPLAGPSELDRARQGADDRPGADHRSSATAARSSTSAPPAARGSSPPWRR